MDHHAVISNHLILETKHQTCHNFTRYLPQKENLPNLAVLVLLRSETRPSHPSHNTILLRSETRAACAQSFASWQQATIEIMRSNLSYYYLLALDI